MEEEPIQEKESDEKNSRRWSVLFILLILSYALILILGLVGLIGLVSAIIRGESFSKIFGGGNGLYILSPLIVLVAASRLMKIFRDR